MQFCLQRIMPWIQYLRAYLLDSLWATIGLFNASAFQICSVYISEWQSIYHFCWGLTYTCILLNLFRLTSNKTSKFCVTGFYTVNPPVTCGFTNDQNTQSFSCYQVFICCCWKAVMLSYYEILPWSITECLEALIKCKRLGYLLVTWETNRLSPGIAYRA